MHPSKSQLDWTNIFFFISMLIISIAGTFLLCMFDMVRWPTWILAGAYMIISGLGVTGGYHRLFAHKTYKAHWLLRLFYLAFGAAAFEGSALEWSTDHRNHHRYTDTDKDPYGINKGFWHAHMGWLFFRYKRDYGNVEDLSKDILVYLQHKYYLIVAIFFGFIVPAGIAALWGDPLGGLVVAGVLRMTLNHQFTFAINSVCHYFGNRSYSLRQSARDNWVTAFFTFGEGYHNFHHQFPLDYRNGVRCYHFDPTKWFIRSMAWLGVARELNRIGEHRIIRYRLQVDEQLALQKLNSVNGQIVDRFNKMLEPIRDRVNQALNYFEELENRYLNVYKQKKQKENCGAIDYRQRLRVYRFRLKGARREIKEHLVAWSEAVSVVV